MTFSKELDKLIQKSNFSKNQIIKETGMDRSTFFQILSDRRFPSESTFRSLLLFFIDHKARTSNGSSISQCNLDQFLRAYLCKALSKVQYDQWKITEKFIHAANASLSSFDDISNSPSKAETDDKVSDFLIRQMNVSDGILKFYLSPELIDRFCIKEAIHSNGHSDLTIQQLSGIYQSSTNKYTESQLDLLAKNIGLLNQQPINYSIYYDNDSKLGKQNSLFPYYLIGTNNALLLSEDGNESFLITKNADVEMIQKRFDAVLANSTPLFTQEKNYMDLAKRLYSGYQNNADQHIYSVAERPCFLKMVTPSIISKYAPTREIEKFANEYVNTVQSMPNFYALNSYDGVKQFEKDHKVIEAGMDFTMDDTDMSLLKAEYNKKLWNKLILLPFSNCFIHNWEIAVYYPDTVFLSRYDKTDCIICIHDKNIIDALFTYYDSMFRLLRR